MSELSDDSQRPDVDTLVGAFAGITLPMKFAIRFKGLVAGKEIFQDRSRVLFDTCVPFLGAVGLINGDAC